MISPSCPPFSIDLTAVGRGEARNRVRRTMEAAGETWRDFPEFWSHFLAGDLEPIPPRTLVVGDLSRIVGHYRAQGPHRWIASVRRSRPIFLALVRTPRDEGVASMVDDVLRDSDLRLVVARDAPSGEELRSGLAAARRALDPDALLDVRYAPLQDAVWVQFGDGLAGMPSWSDLGIGDLRDRFIAESATAGEGGWTLELVGCDGDLLEIDATAIRGVLDYQRWLELERGASISDREVGIRLREAREAAGLTQMELGRRVGIEQAVISRLERGRHSPRIETLRRIAGGLGRTVSQLLTLESRVQDE